MAKTKKNKGYRGVSRIDQPEKHNHGYYVRLTRNGKRFAKFYSDRAYGGKEQALAEALKYYAELDNKYPRMPRQLFAQIARRKNRAGLLGVSKITKHVQGSKYTFWQATWSPETGKIAKKSFSVKKYGDDHAKELALRARKKGVSEMAN
jgi:hypothetical protein